MTAEPTPIEQLITDQAAIDRAMRRYILAEDQRHKLDILTETATNLGYTIVRLCPPGRERDQAIINLEQTEMWAAAAVGREGPPCPPEGPGGCPPEPS